MSSASLAADLTEVNGPPSLPWRQSVLCQSPRRDGTWLVGAIVVLMLTATLPISFLCMAILTMAAVATCLRAFALHQYTQRLSELTDQRRGDDSDGSGAASGTVGALSSAAQRRSRRPSLLGAVAAAGSPFNLLHFRLSLVDRDFTEPGDYELLLRLDELEAAAQAQRGPQPSVPLPESQLAELPVHVHRTPTKKSKRHGGGPFSGSNTFSPRAAADGKDYSTPQAGAGPDLAAAAPVRSLPAAAAGQAPRVPVVQEVPQRHWLLPAAQPAYPASTAGSHSSSGSLAAARAATSSPSSSSSSLAPAASRTGSMQQLGQIEAPQANWLPPAPTAAAAGAWSVVAAAAPAAAPGDSGESEEDDEVLCSVCLEPFAEGAKILSLPCRHQYHEECVKTWLRYKGAEATCPNCISRVWQTQS